jgi:CheY-like chemotaxis protein
MRVLVADDEEKIASLMARLVEECGHDVVATVTTGGLDVVHLYDHYKPDVVLMDIMMPKFNGLTICHALVSKNPPAKVILFSGKLSADHPFVTASGAYAFLQKPVHLSDLRKLLAELETSRKVAA